MDRAWWLISAAIREQDALAAVRAEVHAEIKEGGKALSARQRELTSWQQGDVVPPILGLFCGCGCILLCRRLRFFATAPRPCAMKLSFSFSKKAEPKRVVPALQTKPKPDEGKEIITSLEGGEVKIDGKAEQAKAFTIPCNNPLKMQTQKLRNEPTAAAKAKVSATPESIQDGKGGLVLPKLQQQLSADDAEAMRELLKDAEEGEERNSVPEVAPILMREKSRRAREGGAADVSKDAYEKVPVEAFGLALLRGMGYDPEKHKTKPIWHEKPRDNLLGLGVQPLLPSEKMALKRPKDPKDLKDPKGEKSEKEPPEKKAKESPS